ncbi:MAG: ATP-dependent DNA ligase [Candidatus Aenigmarchaeota archaeon]|nr:ATP-dependent DNA ligase [Candidatus Aenigmarchaeota archaeon]
MKYSELADVYEKLEKTQSKLEKADILAELFSKAGSDDLPKLVFLASGRVFPSYSEEVIGIADQLMTKSIARATGFSAGEVEEKFKETGDLGLSASHFVEKRKQRTLLSKELTLEKVFENIRELSTIEGTRSQKKKMDLIAELFASAEPKEAVYITRTVLEELRIGVARGIIRDAIVKAFLKPEDMEEKKKLTEVTENAFNITSDFSKVAKIAKEKGVKGLEKVEVKLGQPMHVMLGEKVDSIKEIIDKFGKVAVEYKYDGLRAEIMKKGDKIWVFTRRLENVSHQFPDLVEFCKKALKPDECVVDGEILAIDPKTGYPQPFQNLSQRIHRKYNIEEMTKKIPIQVNIFDIMYLNGEMLFDKPFNERRKILEKSVKTIPKKFQLAKQIVTDDLEKAEFFYKQALDAGQEGVFLKVLDSKYVFGRHVDGWYKIKPIMETLDLVIVAATWGEGKRTKWLSSYVLACRDQDTGSFLPCGMMGTGLTEEMFQVVTDTLKPLITEEKGKEVKIKPRVVVEVAYQEIQKSPTYEAGYALRFPRMLRVREADRSPDECDTLERLKKLYKSQGREG